MVEEGQKTCRAARWSEWTTPVRSGIEGPSYAACLEPGASVSKLALGHGVNANLVWKWIRKRTQAPPFSPSSTSAFLPVQITAASSKFASEMPATDGEELPPKAERIGPLSSPAKVSASLPNGVRLTLECGDANALAAIIGALGNVQTGR